LKGHEAPLVGGDLLGERCGGSYTITSVLGEGGMGLVYRAVSEMLAGKEAAVKVLNHEMTHRPEALARFRAEVYAAGRIADPNIVRVFDAGTFEDGRLYMMMEYCGGGSLSTLLEKQGPLSFELIVTLIAPICSALHAAHHDAKITHRDIKPANILLSSELGGPVRAKLADFGIAKLHDAQLEFGLRTGTKKLLGSPGYMAPEQCGLTREAVDHRADIYALGSLIYETVTGRRPYPSNNLYELVSNVIQGTPFPRPSELRRDLPPEWEATIMACLAHRREERIQSVKEVIHRLARAIPNGEALMGFVAPRLVESQIAPTANTINDDIGPAATQWATRWSESEARDIKRRRGWRLARTLATLGAGALLGGALLGIFMASRTTPGGEPAASSSTAATATARGSGRAITAAPQGPLAVPRDIASTSGPDAPAAAAGTQPDAVAQAPADAAVAAPAAVATGRPPTKPAAAARPPSEPAAAERPPTAAVTARAPADTPATVAAARPRPGPSAPAPAPMPTSPVTPSTKQPRAAAAPTVLAAPGTLRVIVDPWADVTIVGRTETFTTPGAVPLSAGSYRVVLTKGTKKESIDVKISPNEVTTIKRTW
jgi:serine/threonine-protein kinase